ncbi:phage tail tip fiber protein [Enterobacter wuhouensis]|uniref:phage tail tip fiber protein n=1 Tax=Enterobacter wuhouensis TaxID=2529381 RepID=UPI001F6198B2|nr:Fur-regulated protein [Enterobacter wuhouensis]
MGQKIITLSGAATDVLYALFFRGALQSGDLPAKSGAAELRELGFAETRHAAPEYQKENYFTFLTAEGQEFAIKHLVNTRFGVPAGGYIGSPVDKPGRDIRCGCPIEGISWGWFVDKSGQAYIHKALIGDGVLSTSYNVKFHVADKGKSHEAGMAIGVEDGQSNVVEAAQSIVGKAVVSATKVKIKLGDELTQAVIDAVRESELFTAIQVNIDAQTASLTGLQQAMHDAVNDAIRNALKPGGAIWVQQRAC